MKKFLLSLVALFAVVYSNAATVYFDNTDSGWEKVYGYSWSPDYDQELSTVEIDGHTLYAAELNNDEIIFRGDNTKWADNLQTANLTVTDGAVYGAKSIKSKGSSIDPIAKIVDGKYVVVQAETSYDPMFLVGEMTGWGASAKYKMSTNDGVTYTLTVPDMTTQNFKFFGGAWGIRELTGAGTGIGDGIYNLSSGSGDMSLKNGGNVTFTLVKTNDDFTTATLKIEGAGEVAPDQFTPVFLMSDRYSFQENQNFKMETTDGKTYTLNVKDAGPDTEFKFMAKLATGDKWFSNGEQNIHNESFTISGNDDVNMTLHTGGDVTFTVQPRNNFESLYVTIAGQIHTEEEENAPIYFVGKRTNWTVDEEYKLSTEDGVNYSITIPDMSDDELFQFYGRDEHKHYFSNGMQNLENTTATPYTLTASTTRATSMNLDAGGNVTFTLKLAEDHQSAELGIAGQEEIEDEFPRMYLIGERTDNYTIMEKYRMQTTDGVTYTLNVPDMSNKSFRFCGKNTEINNLGGAGAALADGTYDLTASKHAMTLAKGGNVTFTLVQSDNFASAKLTIEGQGETPVDEIQPMYLIGAVNSWNVDTAIPFESTDGETYSLKTYIPANSQFKFFGGAWGTRELTMKNGLNLEDGTYEVMPIKSDENGDYNLSLKTGGNVTLTLVRGNDAFTEATLTIAGQSGNAGLDPEDMPENLYLVGEVNNNDWDPENPVAMTTESTGIFTLKNAKIDGPADNTGLFSFTSKISTNKWADCGMRFGDAAGDGGKMTPGEDGIIRGDIVPNNENAFEIENGTYDITVNLNTLKLTAIKVQGGNDEPTDDGYQYFIHGNIFGEWKSVEMEMVDGKAVLKDIEVEAGEFGIKVEDPNKELDPTNPYDSKQIAWYAAKDGEADVVLDEVKTLVTADSKNLTIAKGKYTFTFDPANATLLVTGTELEDVDPVYAYVISGAAEKDGSWDDYAMEEKEGLWTVTLNEPLYTFGVKQIDTAHRNQQTAWYSADGEAEVNENDDYQAKVEGTNWTSPNLGGKTTYTFNPQTLVLTVKAEKTSGVNAIDAEEGEAIYFNLQGQRVANPDKGIYIRVVNGKAQKVVK